MTEIQQTMTKGESGQGRLPMRLLTKFKLNPNSSLSENAWKLLDKSEATKFSAVWPKVNQAPYEFALQIWDQCDWRGNWSSNKILIARFMGPIWGPSGAERTQVGPMLAPWTLLSGDGNGDGMNWYLHRPFHAPTRTTSSGCFMLHRTVHALWSLYGNPYRNRAEKKKQSHDGGIPKQPHVYLWSTNRKAW